MDADYARRRTVSFWPLGQDLSAIVLTIGGPQVTRKTSADRRLLAVFPESVPRFRGNGREAIQRTRVGRCTRLQKANGSSRVGRDDRMLEANEPKCRIDCAPKTESGETANRSDDTH